MNHQTIIASSSSKPLIPISPFSASNPLPLTHFTSVKLRRYRVSSRIRCTLDHPATDVFGGKRELTGVQPVVEALPPPLRLVGSVALVAAALATGYGLGLRIGGTRNAGLGGAVALGAAGGAAVYSLNSSVPEVAAVNLHNFVAGCDDPLALNKEDIQAIATRYGISKQDESFVTELCDLYCRFVMSVLPPGKEDLNGKEVEKIISFKNALGIDDPDAANMHMEIGRRIFRQRLETEDRDAEGEQRRAFQKLVYVSSLVFGEEASTFLLPWKRVLGATDAQVEVAIRDNAQRLYALKLKSVTRDLDVEQLVNLRNSQLECRLSDELAEDMFREHMRKLVEENISIAVNRLKSRAAAQGDKVVIDEVNKILAFNNKLVSFANHPDAGSFARGVGQVSLVGGEYDSDKRINDLKLLYRAYFMDSLSSGDMDDNKLSLLQQLRTIFGLGKREAEVIMLDVTSKSYRKLLIQGVTSGQLEAAESKAAFLQGICDKLRFDPQKASEIHEEIYRQKLQQCLTDGELGEEDVSALLRLRVMLCIPQKTVEAAHAELCGNVFEKVVKDAIGSGLDGYDADTRASVRKSAHGLRLTREAAMSVASKAVRKIFMNYVREAKEEKSHRDSAKVLKTLIAFNTSVVTELVADIKGDLPDAIKEEQAQEEVTQTKDEDEWESLGRVRKTKQAGKELEPRMRKRGQTDITLKDNLSESEKIGLYRSYLIYCLTGDTVDVPFGMKLSAKKDERESIYLEQLGEVLGLTKDAIVKVHTTFAEQNFRKEAEVILADGQLTKGRMEELNDLQKKWRLSEEHAQKVIKSITTSKMAGAIQTAIAQGRLNLKQVRELKKTNVDLDSIISEGLRENLYKKTVDEIFSAGVGEFDEEEVYQKIPAELSINADKAKVMVHELAKTRLPNALIQAVAFLRQKKHSGVVSTLNNLLAFDKAVPAEPLTWDSPEELADLFTIYLKSKSSPESVSRLQYLLGISDADATVLRERGAGLDDASHELDVSLPF